ncbi:dicarboxylate/amino acid:cation symporter [Phenylobacterium sp.]|uniref:dicarboxylate/amino acid:cation symporter n=1 Tax=Phenylobacterium sp. TaxID=1871053 RepID=UPI00398308D0
MTILRSLSVRVLLALIAGLALGAAAQTYGGEGARRLIAGVEAVGGLWLNALRMTVVPLVFAVLVTGIASVADAAATGKLAARATIWFAALLVVGCGFTLAFNHGFYAVWPVSEAGAAALRAGAQAPDATAMASATLGDWIRSLAPANPLKAAAEDAILPLVVFATFFGFAITRLPQARALQLTEFFRAVGDAMIQIVRWVLWAAPLGVFALGLGVGLRAGFGAAGVLAQYIVAVVASNLGITVLAFVLAVVVGRVPLIRWTRAVSPVLVAAFATQSSLACLPAMIERTRDELGISPRVTDLVLPLAVAVFRLTSPVANLAAAIFVAQIYGLAPSAVQYAGAVFVALAVSVGSVGLPGQVSFFASVAPICLALGLPLELLPILLAVEVAPDIFRTVGNVAGDMSVTTILGRNRSEATDAAPRAA